MRPGWSLHPTSELKCLIGQPFTGQKGSTSCGRVSALAVGHSLIAEILFVPLETRIARSVLPDWGSQPKEAEAVIRRSGSR